MIDAKMNELWVVRHAETEWSARGRHTSFTDVPLTEAGRVAASALEPALAPHRFGLVLTSPRARARDTAAAAGFADAVADDDLCEWDYGELEGLTTAEIRSRGGAFDEWSIWRGPMWCSSPRCWRSGHNFSMPPTVAAKPASWSSSAARIRRRVPMSAAIIAM